MRAHVLAELGRTHDPANVERAVGWARDAGIERVNLDLIYGSPAERVADWEATLDAALALRPTHVSAYALTVEPGTPLGKAVAGGTRTAPDDDDQATKYELTDGRLGAAGFEWYEISNWALPGEECRHNLLYWSGDAYAAIGCAAHGHRRDPVSGVVRRSWNVRTPERYVEAVAGGQDPEAGAEELDPAAAAAERLVLALRTRAGIKLDAPDADLPGVHAGIESLHALGLVERRGEVASLTLHGRLLANEVAVRLLGAIDDAGTRSSATRSPRPSAPAPAGTR
jgi:oxygen-independent coproporphyrinogen-3 oxidase